MLSVNWLAGVSYSDATLEGYIIVQYLPSSLCSNSASPPPPATASVHWSPSLPLLDVIISVEQE